MENPTISDRFLSQMGRNAGLYVFFVSSMNKLSANRIDAKQK